MAERAGQTRVEVLARGGYARREVDVGALRRGDASLELSLAQPFGELFSALLPARAFRVRQLHLEYVQPERLAERVTYSAQVGEPLEGGQALELRLLVARGAWLCVRGHAVIALEAQPAEQSFEESAFEKSPDHTTGQRSRGNGHG